MRWILFLLAWSGLPLFLCIPFPCLAQNLTGTAGDDILTVESGETYDYVYGNAGDDTITNHGTVNVDLLGNAGNDVITNYGTVTRDLGGGDGNDVITNAVNGYISFYLRGDDGNDLIVNYGRVVVGVFGDDGDDIFYNYGRVQYLNSGYDNDLMYNSGTVDTYVNGYSGDDTIVNAAGGSIGTYVRGGEGNDLLYNYGAIGDEMRGDQDNDLLYNYGTVGTTMSGGSGDDTLTNSGTVANLYGDIGGANIGTDVLYLYGGARVTGTMAEFETVYKLGSGSVTIGAMDMDGGDLFVDMYQPATQFSVGSTADTTGNLNVSVLGGHWTDGQSVDLFSTGPLGTWASQNLTYTSGVLTFTIATSQVTVARGSYSQVVDPSHASPRRLALLLDSLAETTSGDWDNLFSALDFLPAGRMEDAINQLGPSLTDAMQGQIFGGQHLLGAALAARPALGAGANPGGFTLCVTGAGGAATDSGSVDLASVRAFQDGVARVFSGDWDADAMQAFAPGNALTQGGVLASAISGLAESEALGPSMSLTSLNRSYWMRLVGGQEFNESRDGFPGSTAYTMGVAGGVDFRLDDQWTWGLHTAFMHLNTELDDTGGSAATGWSAHLGATAAYEDGPLTLDGSLDLFHAQWITQREIVFGGLDRTAHADVSVNGLAATVIGAYEFRSGDSRFAPTAGLELMVQHQGAYTEDDAGALNLHVDGVDAASLRTRLGGRVARDFEVETAGGRTLAVTPEVRALWLHEFLADSTDISCEFEGGGSFDSATPDPDRNSLLLGAGLTLGRQDSPSFYLQGDTELSAHNVGYRAALGFRIPF